GRRAGGRGHDEPVGRVAGEEETVDRHGRVNGVAGCRLLDHRLVQCPHGAGRERTRRRVDFDGEGHALLDVIGPFEEPFEGAGQLGGLQLGQVPETADVDAEHGYALAGDELDSAKHGAVAPQADGEVEAHGQLFGIVPVISERMVPMMTAPCDANAPVTSASTRSQTAGSRMTPRPRLASARPASNWGFTRATRSASAAANATSRPATMRSEMNERSAVT